MKLGELQSLFQDSVLAGAPSSRLLALLRPPARAQNIAATFAVYHDGFRLRMAEFLSNDYPVLAEAMGNDGFAAMVEAYWRAHPSKFRNARWVGASLPQFLRATPPYAEDRFLCGLAALEAALAKSFDAADAAALAIEILRATSADDWPGLRFGFHPSVIRIETCAAALAAYEAFQAGEPVLRGRDEAETALAVWRCELDVNYRVLDTLEDIALAEAMAGAPFGDICAGLAFARPKQDAGEMAQAAGGFLVRWFADGVIVAAASG
ncbi:DNA-binding domain-containing protein [Rhodoblastus acidophilus]|uniref:DNA-binding domain-containing protein n=1 Tax=Candidatus Rhodoblastus alkanivorans TaxID=2954117 RepID=A0ABS9Z9S6_9HYPH|nr:DNA-binding domain-containing protein [Candidatus Rhodoblastus alkanivorans]MCI4680823.1 DNA-binding domain-containing protein [Candidatus Rhodoblastus alkanivorans]MCI4684378.1 DNA-binding domain-containing protein [Candidatus Rhodoblastus alkanivorans]MDI4641699.1 DNA-binding domain-containing protein [Rhodoblastus acidophilus]